MGSLPPISCGGSRHFRRNNSAEPGAAKQPPAHMTPAASIARELAQKTRTLVLGGAAVILHGLNRSTQDLDLWIDPAPSPEAWAKPIVDVLQFHPELRAVYLDDSTGQWEKVELYSSGALPLGWSCDASLGLRGAPTAAKKSPPSSCDCKRLGGD